MPKELDLTKIINTRLRICLNLIKLKNNNKENIQITRIIRRTK